MQLLAATASAALLGVSHASLYPGQSDLNHTCQLGLSPPQSPLKSVLQSPRLTLPLLHPPSKPQNHRQLLHRNLWRPRSLHPILVHLHRPRIQRPAPPRINLDPPRSLARFLQWLIHTILRSLPAIRSPPFPQHHNRYPLGHACETV